MDRPFSFNIIFDNGLSSNLLVAVFASIFLSVKARRVARFNSHGPKGRIER